MLKINRSSKIFVPCPAGAVTGGAELLHQIVDVINRHGGNAFIVYFGDYPHNLPTDYSKYDIKFSTKIEDKSDNIALIYEGYFKETAYLKHTQIVLWWLSVDNYFLCNRLTILELLRYNLGKYPVKIGKRAILKTIIKNIINPKDSVSRSKLKKSNVVCNCYQSEYAKSFLENSGFTNIYPLKDYINDENFSYVQDAAKKENIVVYNPKKGYDFTKKLIDYDHTIKWVPIINLSREGVINLIRSAKVYVDFGYHPGKDRLPREAATNGCCIVTGKNGSAGYKDIDIPLKYKHNQEDSDIPAIINQIHDLLDNYESRYSDFQHYRNCIKAEKEEFENDALKLFSISKSK